METAIYGVSPFIIRINEWIYIIIRFMILKDMLKLTFNQWFNFFKRWFKIENK